MLIHIKKKDKKLLKIALLAIVLAFAGAALAKYFLLTLPKIQREEEKLNQYLTKLSQTQIEAEKSIEENAVLMCNEYSLASLNKLLAFAANDSAFIKGWSLSNLSCSSGKCNGDFSAKSHDFQKESVEIFAEDYLSAIERKSFSFNVVNDNRLSLSGLPLSFAMSKLQPKACLKTLPIEAEFDDFIESIRKIFVLTGFIDGINLNSKPTIVHYKNSAAVKSSVLSTRYLKKEVILKFKDVAVGVKMIELLNELRPANQGWKISDVEIKSSGTQKKFVIKTYMLLKAQR